MSEETRNPTFAKGAIVAVKPKELARLNAAARKTAEGRRAQVDGCFTPAGSNTERVRLYWLNRRTHHRAANFEVWNASQLEVWDPK